MIPPFDSRGLLPGFVGEVADTGNAPFWTTMGEIARRFGATEERRSILRGLLAYRDALRAAGVVAAVQWINGSFVEDCETVRGRPPRDIDVVTFGSFPAISELTPELQELFNPARTKEKFRCDAYVVSVESDPRRAAVLLDGAAYWHGLFGHTREQARKGFLAVSLDAKDDADAAAVLGDRRDS